MFGSRKLGTVRMVCGALHTASYTYSGAAIARCSSAAHRGLRAATALTSDAPAYTSDVRYALQLLAAATSLHHHMREDGVQGHRSWATTAANASATARLARANALLQAWLHPFADSAFEDGSHLSVPPLKHETTTCACRQLAGKPFLDATFPTTSPACPGAPSTPRSSNTGGVSKRHTLQTTAERVVVTLGTLPSRNCTTAVASLVNQSRTPDAIYVAAPKRSVWAGNAKAKLPRGLRAAAGSRLRILQPDHDRGPAEKYLGTLENEVRPQTVVIVADDDWIYPFDFVATLLDALHSLEAASGAAVAVGGSGMRLPNNLSRFVVEQPEPQAPRERHLPRRRRTSASCLSLPTGCRLRVNVGSFGGIAFRQRRLPMLSVVPGAPFLRTVPTTSSSPPAHRRCQDGRHQAQSSCSLARRAMRCTAGPRNEPKSRITTDADPLSAIPDVARCACEPGPNSTCGRLGTDAAACPLACPPEHTRDTRPSFLTACAWRPPDAENMVNEAGAH